MGWRRRHNEAKRFRKMTILRPDFRNRLISKLNLSKNVFNKSWCPNTVGDGRKTKKFKLLLQHFHKEMQ